MDLFAKAIAFLAAGVAIIIFFGLLVSLPVMWLWNIALVPAIPGITKISWLQAWGILILCGLLFKPSMNNNKDS